jgi:glucose-6-phosphate isomerase, archaeal
MASEGSVMNSFVSSAPTSFGRIDQPTSVRKVRLSDLKGVFTDEPAWQRLVADADPLVYEVYLVEPVSASGWDMSYGTTILHPGRVGDECFLTRGHLHEPNDRPELAYVMSGEGVMLLAEISAGGTGAATTENVRLSPGLVAYADGRYAHRVVNTGSTDLVFFSVWPSDTGHDYDTVARRGFWPRTTG